MIMNNTKCIIIHGCPSNREQALTFEARTYDKNWIPWIKQELEKINIEVETPLMPTPWAPDYKKFKAEFDKYDVDENTILIGHSCGCAFLVRWLGETKKSIAKLILVAPWKMPTAKRNFSDQSFYIYEIDQTIKDRIKKVIMFTANDEQPDGKKSLKIFHNVLGGEIINLDDHGHYCLKDMGTEEFPELLKVIIN